ncbi:MAG: sensor histidine kinase [Chloroflexi bacterium]|nr:sensor histidine kinase [Chloroflexota bacterium]
MVRSFGSSLTRRQDVVKIVGAASLPLLLIVMVGIWQGKTLAEARVAEERLALARAGALSAASFIESHLSTARSVARMRALTAPNSLDELNDALQGILAVNGAWEGWGIASPDGKNLATTGSPPGTLDISDRPYFQEAMRTGQPTVSPAVYNRRTNHPTIVLAVPAELAEHGRGAIIVSLSPAELTRELQALRQDAGVRLLLVDQQGKLFAHPDLSLVESLPDVRDWAGVEPALGGEMGSLVALDADGVETLIAYAAVPELGWAVLVTQPAALAFDVVRRQTLLGAVILGLALVLASVISWVLGGRLADLYERQRIATARAEETSQVLRQVSAESERRRRFFEGVIASAPVAIAILRGRDYRYEALNARYQALQPQSPMVGRGVDTIFPAQTARAMRDVFDQVYATGEQTVLVDQAWALDAEAEAENQQGRYFTHIVARLDDDDARPDAILSVVLETTETVVARRRVQREKDEMLSTASHELKTPLTSLGLAAQMIERMVERGPMDEARLTRHLGTIRAQVARVSRLIRSLLDISRIESGRLGLNWEPVDLVMLARAAVIRERDALPEHTTHEIVLRAEHPQVVVEGDEARLEQVVANLLSNAVKYSPDGGRVEIAVRKQGEQAAVEVMDQGIGVPAAERHLLFAPFSRTMTAVEAGVEGTGLGLYISNRIVQAHGGAIELHDTLGGGSTFRVTLPLHRPSTDALDDDGAATTIVGE